ncbi:hypothetical protein D187_008714 [Cystobacter fuscus DSM 2262]|uniref:Lipoprotein n=1 Tax=Cystobacter fuscus (strain ATCC 25194 / DSM 2262 / NBRC 100088 / M29) TaxID=1242864 RepID=S9PHJ2_CYSF2|nr:hypothetical protein [Cystobacter fuscus]EPX62526.1 hypothetical protein D187_008714 [Cystobacter fuscus DSM 2262]
MKLTPRLKRFPILVGLISTTVLASAAHAGQAGFPLGPEVRLPNVDPGAWGRLCDRADAITKAISRLNPNATEEQKRCTNLLVKVRLYRFAQVVDGFGREGGPLYFPSPDQDGAGGAFERIYEEIKKHKCDDEDGPGGPKGFGSNAFVEAWTNTNPGWNTHSVWGPDIVPHPDPVKHMVGFLTENRERLTKDFPKTAVDELLTRATSGQLTGQDIERFRVMASIGVSYLTLSARQGFALISRAVAVRVLPVWVLPPDYKDVPGKSGDLRKGM